jgi:hypothetical protein
MVRFLFLGSQRAKAGIESYLGSCFKAFYAFTKLYDNRQVQIPGDDSTVLNHTINISH